MGEVTGWPNAFSRSKQNSDAAGMFYQWGQKEPRTFATSSLYNGSGGNGPYGKYPVKIYNDKSELIYQEDGGRDNKGMTPVGGIIYQFSPASSMMETVKKTYVLYGYNSAVVSQVGHSKELWDYYWTSYSRGVDGIAYKSLHMHNTYLDGYIVLRSKSIYDPCPYGYRTPTNGTYNDFKSNNGWAPSSYVGGVTWNNTWLNSTGVKSLFFSNGGKGGWHSTSTIQSKTIKYPFVIYHDKRVTYYGGDCHELSYGQSVRCIEDATGKADGKTNSETQRQHCCRTLRPTHK